MRITCHEPMLAASTRNKCSWSCFTCDALQTPGVRRVCPGHKVRSGAQFSDSRHLPSIPSTSKGVGYTFSNIQVLPHPLPRGSATGPSSLSPHLQVVQRFQNNCPKRCLSWEAQPQPRAPFPSLKNCVTSPLRTFTGHLVPPGTRSSHRENDLDPNWLSPWATKDAVGTRGLRPVFKGCGCPRHLSPARTATVKHLGWEGAAR